MVNFLLHIGIGMLLAVLTGLGTGGGSLLILWLTQAQNLSPQDAQAINLMYFLPAAILSCLYRSRQGKLPVKKILPGIIAGSIMAAVFSYFSVQWNTRSLKNLFGILLLITGVRELFWHRKGS